MAAYPAKNSVLVMDNCKIHHDRQIVALCAQAGVLLKFLPPYSPDYDPVRSLPSFVIWTSMHTYNTHRSSMSSMSLRHFLSGARRNWQNSRRTCRWSYPSALCPLSTRATISGIAVMFENTLCSSRIAQLQTKKEKLRKRPIRKYSTVRRRAGLPVGMSWS